MSRLVAPSRSTNRSTRGGRRTARTATRPARAIDPPSRRASVSGKTSPASHPINPTLLILIIVLLGFGFIMLSSASSVLAYQHYGDSYYYVKHQLLQGGLLGLLAFILCSKLDYHMWRVYAFPIALVSVILLLTVFIPGLGLELLGARRWIHFGSFVLQPSEIVKLTFLMYLAAWLAKKGKDVEHVSYGLLSFVALLGGLVLIIAFGQKDLGTMIVIGVISIAVYFVAGAPLKHLAWIGIAGVISFFALVKIAPYRIARFTAFFNPESDLQGIGYHVNQALIALGSGGLFGVGLGHSRQKFNYLPEAMTDSIFAVIGEELGFLFTMALVAAYIAFVIQSLRIARRAPDQYGQLLAVGITTWIGFQAFVNIGAMVRLLPLTGIPLPFVSYGSSALIMTLAAVGVLANISRQMKSSKPV